MNWQNIVENSELIYPSTAEDLNLRTWSLKKTTCIVYFYEQFQIEDIDIIICNIIADNNGSINEVDLATILGFNIEDNLSISPKRYADIAELNIFKEIVKPLFSWGLVERKIDDNKSVSIIITELGSRAISEGLKYKFFTGDKILFENRSIKPIEAYENLYFPFFSALGIYSEITNKHQIPYKNIELTKIFENNKEDLISRHNLQSKEKYFIYKSDITKTIDIGSHYVDIRLFNTNNNYYPIVFYNNDICTEATDLLNAPENNNVKQNKVEWCLYQKLIKDPNAILDYKTIIPFEDLIELDDLISDERLLWHDQQLFTFISSNATANQWYIISNNCPIDVIKIYITEFIDRWDWTSLTHRFDSDYILARAKTLPWNFEYLSANEDISIDFIKTLLLISETEDFHWDWETIMPRLDFDFILSNIDKIDFDLTELTRNSVDLVKPLIANFPEKKWDWTFISLEYSLSYILNNIDKFSKYLNIKNVINRAFTSDQYCEMYCDSTDFKNVLLDFKTTFLKNFSTNNENYLWNDKLIYLLESTDYLKWESGTYTIGFECNPNVIWSYDYFKKYHNNVATSKGFDFVSKSIADFNIVINYIDFKWNWDIISKNKELIKHEEFITAVVDNLNLRLLLPVIDESILQILFEKFELHTFLKDNPEYWTYATKTADIEFIRNTLKYDWDWSIISERFSSTIKIEALGHPLWVNKWDWKYLSRNLDISKIYGFLDNYSEHWDWEYFSDVLSKSFILQNLSKYSECWNWFKIINERLNKSDFTFDHKLVEISTCLSKLEESDQNKLWYAITKKFDYLELENLIVETYKSSQTDIIKWDYVYFYSLPDFNVRYYISNFYKYVNWNILSNSNKLNNTFKFDENLFSKQVWRNDIVKLLDNYEWDFAALSKIDTICRDYKILDKYQNNWDWDYLTLHCSYFKGLDSDNRKLNNFHHKINFSLLSQRRNAKITEGIILAYIDKPWDWSAISSNKSIHLTVDFISKYIDKQWDWDALSANQTLKITKEFLIEKKDKQWNWDVLSSRKDIVFDNNLLLTLSEKDWNWQEISKRENILFDEGFIEQLFNKPLNWEIASRHSSFIPNAFTLSLLKDKTLNWDYISKNPNLSLDTLWDYRYKLNWNNIVENKIFDIKKIENLIKYADYINWNYISDSPDFNISIDNLIQFKEKINWDIINKRFDLIISNDTLELLYDVLDWKKASTSTYIVFSELIIEKFRHRWDWSLLRNNPNVIELLNSTLSKYKKEFNCADFVDKFVSHPYIYHFTHLFNAVDIIKNRKILSRNKTDGKFANAAGNLVARRDTAHNYARFYYRPQTPTQFYNECLGWDCLLTTSYGKSFYNQARNLGLPKCPMPVFFKFDIREVIQKMPLKCYYSTGNMQTNWANVEKISENPTAINTTYLYSDVTDYDNYKQYSQQEFLVEEEFDFSELNSFEIICYNDEQVKLIKEQLSGDSICQKITSNNQGIFHRKNRQLNIIDSNNEILISSEYRDDAYLSIKGKELKNISVLTPENVIKETNDEIIAYPLIKFLKTDLPIEIYLVDLTIGQRNWLIYSNYPIASNLNNNIIMSSTQITPNLLEDFAKLEGRLLINLSKNIFQTYMVNSYHGIGHTTRVLFATYLLINLTGIIDEELQNAMYYAAIIHDLGKSSDREGAIHGENSAELYKNKIYQLGFSEQLSLQLFNAVKYHSVDDHVCPQNVRENIIWKYLKDADALDRARFNRGCDKSYLRLDIFKTDYGNEIINFMNKLAYKSNRLNWDKPYQELTQCLLNLN